MSVQDTQFPPLGQEKPLEKERATHSSILYMGVSRQEYLPSSHLGWPPTPVFLPGESHGRQSLEGCSIRGHRVRHELVTEQQLTSIKPVRTEGRGSWCSLQSCPPPPLHEFLAAGRSIWAHWTPPPPRRTLRPRTETHTEAAQRPPPHGSLPRTGSPPHSCSCRLATAPPSPPPLQGSRRVTRGRKKTWGRGYVFGRLVQKGKP